MLQVLLSGQYDDRKAAEAYANEFCNARQTDQETVVVFFGRVRYLALQAYPTFQVREDADEVISPQLKGKFIECLRCTTIRRVLIFHTLAETQDLKRRANGPEHCEKIVTPQSNSRQTIMRHGMVTANFRFRPHGFGRGRFRRIGVSCQGVTPPRYFNSQVANNNSMQTPLRGRASFQPFGPGMPKVQNSQWVSQSQSSRANGSSMNGRGM